MKVSAFRYCLGRMTGVVFDCVQCFIDNWEDVDDNERTIIYRELLEEIDRDDYARLRNSQYKPLGMDCDRVQWERLLSHIENHG
jgi:hypothetical protein